MSTRGFRLNRKYKSLQILLIVSAGSLLAHLHRHVDVYSSLLSLTSTSGTTGTLGTSVYDKLHDRWPRPTSPSDFASLSSFLISTLVSCPLLRFLPEDLRARYHWGILGGDGLSTDMEGFLMVFRARMSRVAGKTAAYVHVIVWALVWTAVPRVDVVRPAETIIAEQTVMHEHTYTHRMCPSLLNSLQARLIAHRCWKHYLCSHSQTEPLARN